MPALSEAELIAAFAKFCQEADFYAGFEELGPPDLPEHLEALAILTGSPEKVTAFEAFGLTGNGSYVAFWQPAGTPATQRLICYLDSEGNSWGVFAASFAEFLTLLPYSIGLPDTILFHCTWLHRSPDSAPPLNVEELTEQFVPMFTAEMAVECPSLPAYVEWLTQTVGLSVAARPVEQIIDAYRSHPNLDDWLDA